MNIKEYFKNKRNVATFTFVLIITVILTLFVATSHSKYVLEKELKKFDLNIIESEEWDKRTLITGKDLNDILLSSGATQVVFGYEDDYAEEIKDSKGTAVCFVDDVDEAKSFKEDDIKLYTVTDSENITTALILSKYQIKANVDSSKMFYNYETLTDVTFSNFETTIVENMDSMFYGCKNLTILDLYKFETPKLTNISNMFYDDILLETIYVSELWNIDKITEKQEKVFYNCVKLKGGNGTTYDVDNPIITSEYACIDTAETTETAAIPGYFTYKSKDTEEEPITFNLVRPSANEKTDTQNTTTNTNTTNNTNTLNTTTNTVTTNTTNSSNTTNTMNTTTSGTSEGDTKTDEKTTTTNNTDTNNVGDTSNTTATNTPESTDTTNTTSTSQEPDTTSVVEDEEKTKEQEIENNIETTDTENVVTN